MRRSVQAIFASHVESLGHSKGWKIQAIQFFMPFSGRRDALFLWIPKRAIGIEKGACVDLSGCFFFRTRLRDRTDGSGFVLVSKPARFGSKRVGLKGDRRTSRGFPRRESGVVGVLLRTVQIDRSEHVGPDRTVGVRSPDLGCPGLDHPMAGKMLTWPAPGPSGGVHEKVLAKVCGCKKG